jgi:hypothetical protein
LGTFFFGKTSHSRPKNIPEMKQRETGREERKVFKIGFVSKAASFLYVDAE